MEPKYHAQKMQQMAIAQSESAKSEEPGKVADKR